MTIVSSYGLSYDHLRSSDRTESGTEGGYRDKPHVRRSVWRTVKRLRETPKPDPLLIASHVAGDHHLGQHNADSDVTSLSPSSVTQRPVQRDSSSCQSFC